MSKKTEEWCSGILSAMAIAEAARLDRPEKPPGSHRRRCGDVIRWKANNDAVDQIVSDLRRALLPSTRARRCQSRRP